MLDLAVKHKNELEVLFSNIAFQDKFKYANYNNYYTYNVEFANDSWLNLEFVSVDKNNKVIGFLSGKLDRNNNAVSSLRVINFYDLNYTFSKDFHQFLHDLFVKFDFNKINFTVIVGNPAEKMYDKYIKKYNGRIVGTYKDDVKLFDGKYYDLKAYEILKKDYLKV